MAYWLQWYMHSHMIHLGLGVGGGAQKKEEKSEKKIGKLMIYYGQQGGREGPLSYQGVNYPIWNMHEILKQIFVTCCLYRALSISHLYAIEHSISLVYYRTLYKCLLYAIEHSYPTCTL